MKKKLIRKEKALAEAAAILVQRKRLRDYYGGNGRGRPTPANERQTLIDYVREAMANGARLSVALREIRLNERSWQASRNMWKIGDLVPSGSCPVTSLRQRWRYAIARTMPAYRLRKSSSAWRVTVFIWQVNRLFTGYCGVMARYIAEGGNQTRPITTWKATGLNQVYTWDITFLSSVVKGLWYYLYLVVDIYSRKFAGQEVYEEDSGEWAATLMERTVLSERCYR